MPATESIAAADPPLPWGAPCGHPSDVQICSRQICLVEGQIVRTDDLHGDSRPRVAPRDGRNEHVPVSVKKTSEGASNAVCNDSIVKILP